MPNRGDLGSPGAMSHEHASDELIRDLVDRFKPQLVEEMEVSSDATVWVRSYRTQVVAGHNYFVRCKVETGTDQPPRWIDARIYRDFTGITTFQAVRDVSESDPIEYFE